MKKALIVGIDNYSSAPLSGCVNDANAVAELLKKDGSGFPNFDVKQELNIKTKGELKTLVDDLFSSDDEVALFYFSGHGSSDNSGYLVTPAYPKGDLGLSMEQVIGAANNSKYKNKIIIIDCCYSGKIGESNIIQSNETILGSGVTIMIASSRDEVSMEVGGQGVFTGLFLQALRGSAADITGRIPPAGIYAFIDQSLGAWEQRSIFKTNTSQFLSIREIEPRVSKTILRKLGQYFESPSDQFKLDPSFEFTNNPKVEHEVVEPYANQDNVNKFKELQLFETVGLVEPVDEDHIYFAAMKSKGCKLTGLGLHYWKLSKDERF